jgi:hypothetical protein
MELPEIGAGFGEKGRFFLKRLKKKSEFTNRNNQKDV